MDQIEKYIAHVKEDEGPSLNKEELDVIDCLHEQASLFNNMKREKEAQRILLEPTLNEFWNQQVSKLIRSGVHKKLGMSEEEYRSTLPRFSDENLEGLTADETKRYRPYLVETRLPQTELFSLAEVAISGSAIDFISHDEEFDASDLNEVTKHNFESIVKVLETNQNFQPNANEPYIIWNKVLQLTPHEVVMYIIENQKPSTLGTIFHLENSLKERSIRSVEALNWILQTSDKSLSAITDIYLFHNKNDFVQPPSTNNLLISRRPIEIGEESIQPLRLVYELGFDP